MIHTPPLANHFLVATPGLVDDNFARSVVYVYEHNEEGAVGVIVNKPAQINLGNVLEHLNISFEPRSVLDQPVLMGGPVGQEHGFIVFEPFAKPEGHPLLLEKRPQTVTFEDPDSSEEILISASKELLRDIAKGQGPNHFLVTLGYAGWDGGQLEKEITRNDWLVVPFNRDILFNTPLSQRWHAAATLIGINIHALSSQIGHA